MYMNYLNKNELSAEYTKETSAVVTGLLGKHPPYGLSWMTQ